MRFPLILIPLLLLTGCSQYEFELLQPAELQQHIGRKRETAAHFERPPLAYHLQAAEGRLVMQISNTADDAVELLGPQSYIVDPDGQSRPLPGALIAPHSFIKLILPPMRPMYYPYPSYGFGFGYGYGWRHSYWGVYAPFYYEPAYVTAYDPANTYYWSWHDQSTVKMRLAFRHGKDTVAEDFAFQRRKV